jgi:hypothetical protein
VFIQPSGSSVSRVKASPPLPAREDAPRTPELEPYFRCDSAYTSIGIGRELHRAVQGRGRTGTKWAGSDQLLHSIYTSHFLSKWSKDSQTTSWHSAVMENLSHRRNSVGRDSATLGALSLKDNT